MDKIKVCFSTLKNVKMLQKFKVDHFNLAVILFLFPDTVSVFLNLDYYTQRNFKLKFQTTELSVTLIYAI